MGSEKMAIPGFCTDIHTCDWLQYCGWKFMDYCPYILNFMPSNFHLFGLLKKHMATDA
jgi:hypothetical protein